MDMSTHGYDWDDLDSPPEIALHSVNKHEILRGYLSRYIRKLTNNRRMAYLNLAVVDGFAGGGIYTRQDNGELHFGSPCLAIDTIRGEEKRLNRGREKPIELRVNYYFVDKEQRFLDYLKNVFARYDYREEASEKFRFIPGEFSAVAPSIVKMIGERGKIQRAIFILDQYGYSQVPVFLIRRILSDLPHAEVILTFAVDHLIDYLSADPKNINMVQRRLDDTGLSLSVSQLISTKQESPEYRFLIQDLLSTDIQTNCGARFYTRYFIRTEDSHRSLWLVHLSQHEVARDEMLQVHWENSNCSEHAGFSGMDDIRMLGYTSRNDPRLGQLALKFGFDDWARDLSTHTLLAQLPEYIYKNSPLTFRNLIQQVCNSTPADSNLIKNVLDVLLSNHDITVSSARGVQRIKGSAIAWDDLIHAQSRRLFPFNQVP